jgi:hypothetical protein
MSRDIGDISTSPDRLIVAAGIEGELPAQLACVWSQNPDLAIGDEELDRPSLMGSADADVVQPAVVAQSDGAIGIDPCPGGRGRGNLLSRGQAAGALIREVSEPTVRKWLAEGLLERVEDHKPVEIAQRSVIEVERVLDTVRESYPARRWSEALAAFLHDRDLLGQEWVREGVEQLRHGELIER